MANPFLADEDELDQALAGASEAGEPQPAATIAGPQTNQQQVMERIGSIRSGGAENPYTPPIPSSNESSFDLGPRPEAADPAQLERARQLARDNSLAAGLGRAVNALAAGTGYKPDNSGFDALEKQGQNEISLAQTNAKTRQQQVKDWIAGKTKQSENLANRDLKEKLLHETVAARQQSAAEAAANRNALSQAKSDEKSDKHLDDLVRQMKDDLDPNKARGGNMAFNQKKIDQAERLEGLINDSNGNIRNLDSRQVEELAIGLNSMLSNSSSSAVAQVEALVPHSAMGSSQKLKEWLLNDPQGANQQAFVQRMAETVGREKEIAGNQVRGAQVQRLPAYGKLKESDPDRYGALLRSYGIDEADIDQNGRYTPSKKSSPGEVGGGFPRQVRKSGKVAVVSNQAELDEAKSEGWQ